jgi:prophage antirepressor-like protein
MNGPSLPPTGHSTSSLTPVADLWQRPNVSMVEAIRMTGYSRRMLNTIMGNGKVASFKEGALYRVNTTSLRAYFESRDGQDRQERLAQIARENGARGGRPKALPAPGLPNVFHFGEKPVRLEMKDGEPWWVANDICDVLEHSNARMAIQGLDEDEKGVSIVYTPSGTQEMNVINEPGLYSLILRSRKPEAKAFKRWVTHEVLPQIRKTGAYAQKETPALVRRDGASELAAALREVVSAFQESQRALEARVLAIEARKRKPRRQRIPKAAYRGVPLAPPLSTVGLRRSFLTDRERWPIHIRVPSMPPTVGMVATYVEDGSTYPHFALGSLVLIDVANGRVKLGAIYAVTFASGKGEFRQLVQDGERLVLRSPSKRRPDVPYAATGPLQVDGIVLGNLPNYTEGTARLCIKFYDSEGLVLTNW